MYICSQGAISYWQWLLFLLKCCFSLLRCRFWGWWLDRRFHKKNLFLPTMLSPEEITCCGFVRLVITLGKNSVLVSISDWFFWGYRWSRMIKTCLDFFLLYKYLVGKLLYNYFLWINSCFLGLVIKRGNEYKGNYFCWICYFLFC